MYYRWLDRWDERRARRGEEEKAPGAFALDAELAFPDAGEISGREEFYDLAEQAASDPGFYSAPRRSDAGFVRDAEWLTFPSDVTTDVPANNVVWAKVSEAASRDQALVVLHHWNARSRKRQISSYLSRQGISVFEMAMPYHLERSRPGSSHADYMLSASLGRTIQSMRQAVLDTRKLTGWLKDEGYREVSVFGMSLGSWVAALAAAQDPAIAKASLFLTAGSLADMVWTGRATRLICESIESEIDIVQLRKAWSPLDAGHYARGLARPGLDLQIVLARRDKVVMPELSKGFLDQLKVAGASPEVLRLNCGHYSLAMPPHILFAGRSLARFLRR